MLLVDLLFITLAEEWDLQIISYNLGTGTRNRALRSLRAFFSILESLKGCQESQGCQDWQTGIVLNGGDACHLFIVYLYVLIMYGLACAALPRLSAARCHDLTVFLIVLADAWCVFVKS